MTRKCISFKENEIELYNFLQSKRNPSCYVKDLIESDMSKTIKKEVKQEIEEEDDFKW